MITDPPPTRVELEDRLDAARSDLEERRRLWREAIDQAETAYLRYRWAERQLVETLDWYEANRRQAT